MSVSYPPTSADTPRAPTAVAEPLRTIEQVGYFYALGGAILFCGALARRRVARRFVRNGRFAEWRAEARAPSGGHVERSSLEYRRRPVPVLAASPRSRRCRRRAFGAGRERGAGVSRPASASSQLEWQSRAA